MIKTETFERDYRVKVNHEELTIVSDPDTSKFARSIVPKCINPQGKQAYEELLPRLNRFARYWRGSIKGTVDFENWCAEITVKIPSIDFWTAKNFVLFQDIIDLTGAFNVSVSSDGFICIYVCVEYFAFLGDPYAIAKDLSVKKTS